MSTESIATRSDALPEPVSRRGVTEAQWRTLCNSLFPGADPQSVLMVVDYCAARKLDPMKKPCHIVPMRTKDAKTGEWGWRDVVMPGIYEYRTTAQRTGEYLGHSKPEYGPVVDHGGVKAPEWCEMTIYRYSKYSERIEFPVRRYFAEVVGLTKEGKVNDRWSKAPIQMLEKCTEAAGLREAFPDEFGGEPTAEEMDDQRVIEVAVAKVDPPKPAQRKSEQQASNGQAAHPAPTIGAPQQTPVTGNIVAPHQDLEGQPKSAETPKYIGKVVDVIRGDKGSLIKLDTGFQCATLDEACVRAAETLKASGVTVELVTRAPKDPKFVPRLEEILTSVGAS